MSTDTMNTYEEQGESAEHAQAMIEKGEQLEFNNDPSNERPEWLPDKFKSPEDMAQAYANLESKLGSRQEEPAQEETTEQQEEYTAENVQEASGSEVQKAVENAGIDFDVLQKEYNELGGLSEDAYQALEEAGFPQDLVNTWIQGQEALVSNYQESIFQEVGGQEAYGEMLEWAADNLSPQEIAAYDKAVDSGDIDVVKLAVSGLKSKYQSVEGADPSLIGGQSSNTTGGTYGSWAEVTAAMRDSRYDVDPAYRQQVANKLARSNIQ